jgi:hypothetical protein
MKSRFTVVPAVLLVLAGASAQAGPRDAALAACSEALERFYGADTEVRLVSSRRIRGATRLRLAAVTDANHSQFTDCSVGADGIAVLDSGAGDKMVAVAAPAEAEPR